MPWTVSVTNLDANYAAAGVQIVDTLPVGFRYAKGSAHLDGAALADPGRALFITEGEKIRVNTAEGTYQERA